MLFISSSETTSLYRLGRSTCTMLASETRSDNKTVGPYLGVILLARSIGYNLFGSKDLSLNEVYAVAF